MPPASGGWLDSGGAGLGLLPGMIVLRTRRDLDSWLVGAGWRSNAGPVIVPTMGALHGGHGLLVEHGVRTAKERGVPSGCVVWIFVNPTQFNDKTDLARYPRTLDADVRLCESRGASAVFAPETEEIYPAGDSIAVPTLPPVATEPGLEDAYRPGHFAGVCQVVRRFFEIMRPSTAIFGEKDWQQLQVVRAMTAQEGLDVEILASPTVREEDGLAMSSRNRFLDAADRRSAMGLSSALKAACAAETAGEAAQVMERVLLSHGAILEYAAIRAATSLLPVEAGERRGKRACRALVAARVGRVRLIDNCDWASGPGGQWQS